MSPALIQQLLPVDWQGLAVEEITASQWHQLWERWQGWLGCVEAEGFAWQQNGGGYRCWPALTSPEKAPLAINQAMAAYYGNHLDQQRLAQRRHQLGQTLQRAAEREAREAQAQQALLEAVPESDTMQQQADALLSQRQPSRQCVDTAQKLYKRFGFARVGVRKNYYENVEDAIVMWCHDIAAEPYRLRLAELCPEALHA
jgi:GNAT superfamily N-acetyltransferase